MLKKYFGILLAVCLIANAESKSMKQVLIGLVAEFKDRMCYPQDDLQVPQLNPLNIDHFPFNISNTNGLGAFSLEGDLRDVTVQGLGDFVLVEDEVSVSLFTGIKIGIKFPAIKIVGHLKAKGDFEGRPINGPGGHIKIDVEDVYIYLQIKPVVGGEYVDINIAQLKVTISKVAAVLEGQTETEEGDAALSSYVSQWVLQRLAEIMKDEKEVADIRKTLSDFVNNGKLPKHTMVELTQVLMGFKDPFKPFPPGKKCSEVSKPEVQLMH